MNVLVQEDAAGRIARLPGDVAEVHAPDHAVRELVDAGIRARDERVLAAQFERQLLERLSGSLHHRAPRADAADEADLGDPRVIDERGAGVATSGHDVEHAGWKDAVPEFGHA